jgi:hypothetical protein
MILDEPKLSIVIVIHGMSVQADNALFTLSVAYQLKVRADEYEIVVVENPSDDLLGEARAMSHGENVRYFLNDEAGVSPASAANFGVAQCRATFVGLLLDGANLVTPRLVEHALVARHLSSDPLIAVPSYHLGAEPQHVAAAKGYDERVEAELLERCAFREDGYGLFDVACSAPEQERGFLLPFREAACLFFTRAAFEKIGGADLRFDLPGGGALAAFLFSRLCGRPESKFILLAGEGTFHQFHRGVTTSPAPDRKGRLAAHLAQYEAITGGPLVTLTREPTLFGVLRGRTAPSLRQAIDGALLDHDVPSKRATAEGSVAPLVSVAPPSSKGEHVRPKLSIIVVLFRIPRQGDNTVYSLSARHQRNVTEDDYEIVVVENSSDAVYGPERAFSHGRNVRYFFREEHGVSPVPAVNFGFEQARAPLVAFMVDGAHMVTPGLVEHALLAQRTFSNPLIAVPAHHLGKVEHHLNRSAGYDERVEEKLLAESGWTQDGYALFGISRWSGANYSGFLCPAIESSCLFCTREAFESVGRADPRFDALGGGLVNQDLYSRLSRVSGTRFVVLGGEGTFHQFHGGVSTSEIPDRASMLRMLEAQHISIRGHGVIGYDREPVLLGVFPRQSLPFLKESVTLGHLREAMCQKAGRPVWPND